MKKILTAFVVMFVMFCSTCFAFSGTSGQTTTHNGFRIAVSAPSMPKLVYAKMPAFTFKLWPINGRPSDKINGTLSFYDGKTGEFLGSQNVYHTVNFIPPKERRSYIVTVWSNQPVKWSVVKNTKAVGNRYFYEIERTNYKRAAVG